MKSKTLVISEIFPPIHGGSGRWFWELYTRLPSSKVVVAAGNAQGATEFDRTHDLDIVRLPLSSANWGIRSLRGLAFYWKNFVQIRKMVKRCEIKQLHCGRCLPEGVFGLIMYKLYTTPYVCYIHGEDIEAVTLSNEQSFIVRKVLKNAKLLICNSQNTHKILINTWGINPDKALVLNPGMDASKFVPAAFNKNEREKLGWGNRPVLLTVGRLQKRKGHDVLLEALPQILKRFPNLIYVIIGNGEEKEHLESLVKSLSLGNSVQILSSISDEDMIRCYQQCNLFVLPNRTVGKDIEGFGMVLAEAQSCGKPVLAGDSGGTVETMKVGQSGYIVDCTSPKKLASKVVSMLSQSEELKAMGISARRHAEENLDWNIHATKAQVMFDSVSSEN